MNGYKNRLTIIRKIESPNGKSVFLCLCECGNEVAVKHHRLKSGKTKSCGCLRNEVSASKLRKHNTTHGKCGTPEYSDMVKEKRYYLKRYGMTVSQYHEKLEIQNHRCAICGITAELNGKALAVDHCHDTGNVRGLLCHKCNVGIGSFSDSPRVMEKAMKYLIEHGR